jgi:hypothetical protein
MFNLKQFKMAKAEVTQEKQLEGVREPNDGLDTTQVQLEDVRKDEEKNTIENQLDDVRAAVKDRTIETLLDAQKTDGTPVRNGLDKHDQLPINLLAEIEDQKKARAFEKAAEDTDTAFWDKFLGAQMIGEGAKVPEKTGPSQLQNHPDRFKDLKADDVLKNKNVKEMVLASLQDADAMLYHIFREAAANTRDLTENEKKLVEGITRDKVAMTELILKDE